MVMPCCTRCYQKYIKEDGSLSESGLNNIFGKGKYKILKDDDEEKELRVLLFNKIKLCKCICHIEGSTVMH